jgi:type III pantothenate kinase
VLRPGVFFPGWVKKKTRAGCLFVTPYIGTGIRLDVKNPSRVGADRIVNAIAANRIHKGLLIIIDFGTATTIDCVTKDGSFIGGVIVPGPGVFARSLHDYTAQLPLVSLRALRALRAQRIVGRDTIAAIRSGLYFGYKGLIESIIAELKKVMGKKAVVFATGGFSHFWGAHIKGVDRIIPNLTLDGLRYLGEQYDEK